ncbi:MAG: hypothetical protein E6I70_16360 [Chloroflexi bacterium]|nr:MAG: hypothetical protein E6I70_16360 [Chloroflexota bacterium]
MRVPTPLTYALARAAELMMTVPLIAVAHVRILEEEVVDPVLAPDPLLADLLPRTAFNDESVKAGVPECSPFGLNDLRVFAKRADATATRA